MTGQSVNSWLKRYRPEGIKGLETRPGQGRNPILDCSDQEFVRLAVEEYRQRVDNVREALQNATGKEVRERTFRRF
jgi:transposase